MCFQKHDTGRAFMESLQNVFPGSGAKMRHLIIFPMDGPLPVGFMEH